MELCLDLEGIKLVLGIKNYRYSNSMADDMWVDVHISVYNEFINYETHGELLECWEVIDLKDKIKALLDDKQLENNELSFIEPDIEFHFQPSFVQKVGENGCVYVAPGHEFVKCYAELIVNLFLKGALSGHSINLFLDSSVLEKLHNYLRLVTKEIDENDPIIDDYLKNGWLLELQY